jgi:hypothetical protein
MLANLAFGTMMISATVIVHTVGLLAVTHLIGSLTDRFRTHGHRSRIIAILTVVRGTFALLTVEVWLCGIAYYLLEVVRDFETALYFDGYLLDDRIRRRGAGATMEAVLRAGRHQWASC